MHFREKNPMGKDEIIKYTTKISTDWEIIENHHLQRVWKFSDFKEALEFLNITAEVCENENHHANFELGWAFVKILIWTHDVDGLTKKDFELALKFEEVANIE
mgnify:CR=1 FL=1